MIDLDRLLELLDEAEYATRCGCSVTTRAYVRMVQMEILERLDDAKPESERDKARSAYFHIEQMCRERKSPREAILLATEFWNGYDDGQNERTAPKRGRAAYRRGYQFGRDGS